MSVIDGVVLELLNKTEFLTIVTEGPDGPHVVANWGDYLRRLGLEGDRLVMPAGRYQRTEENLRRGSPVQVMIASRSVQGKRSPGQGGVIRGTGSIVTDGPLAERVKREFPWARGALVITAESAELHL